MKFKQMCDRCNEETLHTSERDESSMPNIENEDSWSSSDYITYMNGDYVCIETCLECGKRNKVM